jgi:hypothetical protein
MRGPVSAGLSLPARGVAESVEGRQHGFDQRPIRLATLRVVDLVEDGLAIIVAAFGVGIGAVSAVYSR